MAWHPALPGACLGSGTGAASFGIGLPNDPSFTNLQATSVMSEGGIVESGPPEQIFEACKSEKTRELLAQAALC